MESLADKLVRQETERIKETIRDGVDRLAARLHDRQYHLGKALDRCTEYEAETEETLRILARKMRKYLICPNFTAIRCCKKDPKTQCNPECIECFIQDARQRARWNLKRRKK